MFRLISIVVATVIQYGSVAGGAASQTVAVSDAAVNPALASYAEGTRFGTLARGHHVYQEPDQDWRYEHDGEPTWIMPHQVMQIGRRISRGEWQSDPVYLSAVDTIIKAVTIQNCVNGGLVVNGSLGPGSPMAEFNEEGGFSVTIIHRNAFDAWRSNDGMHLTRADADSITESKNGNCRIAVLPCISNAMCTNAGRGSLTFPIDAGIDFATLSSAFGTVIEAHIAAANQFERTRDDLREKPQ